MDLIITILPMIIKDLPISPRFTPCIFLSRCSSALLQLVNQWLNFLNLTNTVVVTYRQTQRPISFGTTSGIGI